MNSNWNTIVHNGARRLEYAQAQQAVERLLLAGRHVYWHTYLPEDLEDNLPVNDRNMDRAAFYLFDSQSCHYLHAIDPARPEDIEPWQLAPDGTVPVAIVHYFIYPDDPERVRAETMVYPALPSVNRPA